MATPTKDPEITDFAALLRRAGLSDAASDRHAPVFARLTRSLAEDVPQAGARARAYFVPGRIEVMGKHTDYAGGDSLVCPVEQGFCLLAVPTEEPGLFTTDVARREAAMIGEACASRPRPGWARYPETVYRRTAANFGPLAGGLRIAFASTLPPDAGLSSSSAFMIGCFLAMADAHGLAVDPRFAGAITSRIELADYLGHVENGQTYRSLAGDAGVGTFGGSQDHTAILCGEAGAVSRFSYAPTRRRDVAHLPPDVVFVVATSGVPARKAEGAMGDYNQASRLAGRIAERWQARYGGVGLRLRDIVESPPFSPPRMEALLAHEPEMTRRFRHFYEEHTRLVPAAFEALQYGDWEALGHIADRSQALAEAWLGNQVLETIALARLARERGALAASAFGAGYGGAVWALVRADRADAFGASWIEAYRSAFPAREEAGWLVTCPGPAATRLSTP